MNPLDQQPQPSPVPTPTPIATPPQRPARISRRRYALIGVGLLIVVGVLIHVRHHLAKASPHLRTTVPAAAGFIHESGRQLVAGNGTPVKLEGVDVGGWLEWEGWMWGKGLDYIGETAMMSNLTSLVGTAQAQQFQTNVEENYITQADFNAMGADGLNEVRIPFNYTLLTGGSTSHNNTGWTILDNAVAEAQQAHVYVVLVMQEAPCGQSRFFFAGYTGGPTLWQSASCQTSTVALWQAIAARYSNNPDILGYDLLGEPNTTNAQLTPFYQRLTTAVRHVDTHHTIIYEGNDFARNLSNFTTRLDSNQMLSFHAYAWGSRIASKLAGYDPYARSQNSPLYVGEYGQAYYPELSDYINAFAGDSNVAAYNMWTWKQVPELPTVQQIHETAASQKLIDWVNNTGRPKPTPAEATQGMSDFINAIKYQNTTTDQHTQSLLQG